MILVEPVKRTAVPAVKKAFAAAPQSSERVPDVPYERPAPNRDILPCDVASRLSVEFERLKADCITLDEYKSLVDEALADVKQEMADTRQCRRDMDPDDFDFEMERLEADLDECRWRLKWIDDQQYKASISRDGFGEKGKWARFEYVDNDGVVTERSITMWEKRGAYIVGYDRSRKAERTFRQDRISDWTSG
jgi:hypothetical protein